MKTPKKWEGKIRFRKGIDYKERQSMMKGFGAFLKENKIRFMAHGNYGSDKFVICFKKAEDKNFFLLMFSKYFESL